ncbi:MAG: M14 family zinc carboxypeptidase [Vicinamibacterales bacterium]|jgi:hypothetical protein|nr:M14 family zinc carboxypeptidase [Vicinamibacterales bacterium]
MPTTLSIEEILLGSAPLPDLEDIGRSRCGRPIGAWRGGRGPLSVSLVAGCHADEPVGPATLRRLCGWLATLKHDPAVTEVSWSIVPHANPDGEAANAVWTERTLEVDDHQGAADRGFELAAYSAGVVREAPGDDVEFGFPRSARDHEPRPENRAIAAFLADGAPYAVHGSLHSMAFAPGPWFLIETSWADRTTAMRDRLRGRVREMGYPLFDPDRGGEKGFTRIDEGFTTRPDSGAMRRHFLRRGDPTTAALFRPSSMEHVRSLGDDPLTFVSEMPLFLLPPPGARRDCPDPASGTEGRVAFHHWLAELLAGRSTAEAASAAALHGIRPMPIRDQARLQLEFVDAALAAARSR